MPKIAFKLRQIWFFIARIHVHVDRGEDNLGIYTFLPYKGVLNGTIPQLCIIFVSISSLIQQILLKFLWNGMKMIHFEWVLIRCYSNIWSKIVVNSNHSNRSSSEIKFKFDDWMKFNWMNHLTESVRSIWNSKVMVQTNWNGKIETCNRNLVTVTNRST